MSKFYRFIFFLIILIIFQRIGFANGSLRGFITDSTNGEAVVYANIYIEATQQGVATDIRGYYFLPSIPNGKQVVIVSCVGYKTKKVIITIQENKITELNETLTPTTFQIDDLYIYGQKSAENETNLGLEKISSREIEILPTGIESDIFRVIQTSPGVSTTGDITSKYYVRGGGSDQNVVLLNGAPIYYPYHALGTMSVVDPEIINMLEFFKGGFTSQYGGRLSSILNVVTKDGNKNKFQGGAQASFLSGKLFLQGPIPNGSFFVTGRKSYFADVLKKYLNNQDAPFDFYDITFKVNYSNPELDKDSKFILHGFASGDFVDYEDLLRENYEIRNQILGITWDKVWDSPLFSHFALSYSGFQAEVMPNLSNSKPRYNQIVDVTLKTDFAYVYDNKDEFGIGMENKYFGTKLDVVNLYGDKMDYDSWGWDLTIYSNYKFLRWEKIGFDVGVRAKLLAISKKRPFLLEPRINITYHPTPLISLKASVGRYSQEILTLTDENELISIFEPWIIIPDYLEAPEATQFNVGLEMYLTEKLTFEIEGYYKLIDNLIDVNKNKFSSKDNDYINVNGHSYGAEVLIKFEPSNYFIKASYSLGWAYKINDDMEYFPRYDVRHSANLLFGVNFGDGWQGNLMWTLNTGMPFTPIAGFYDRLNFSTLPPSMYSTSFAPVIFWGDKNSARLPVYHRLDFSASKDFKLFLADVTIGISIINVYDKKNIFYFDRDTGDEVYMLPFFPSAFIKVAL
ncbi:MAG: TonB-dependent receptor [Ignavibacteriales bacterium]|nr:TonB-dependent receptor [Ignavibacteriales bacterium]